MKPEAILQSDMLDILFENKNKEYGAYALRKNYNKRLIQALGGTCLIVALFTVLQSMKPKDNTSEIVYTVDSIDLKKIEFPTEDKKIIEPLKPLQKVRSSVNDATIVIKRDIDVPETKIPTVNDLDKGNLGTRTVEAPGIGDPGPVDDEPKGDGGEQAAASQPETAPAGPVNFAEVMPSFNGDIKKYMLRNLRQPDDLEEGQRIIVKVKFVVTKDGEIDDVQVMQSGRSDLDQEVLRVVKKMPRWKPGKQGDRNVAVYFYLPVTFVSNAE